MEDERVAMLEFNAKMAEELQSRLELNQQYEAKIKKLQDQMAHAVATGVFIRTSPSLFHNTSFSGFGAG